MRTVNLLPCPFCGQAPKMEPWHGGSPTKVMISCPGIFANSLVGSGREDVTCHVAPSVTGETPEEAAERWNRRAALADVAAECRRQIEEIERLDRIAARTAEGGNP